MVSALQLLTEKSSPYLHLGIIVTRIKLLEEKPLSKQSNSTNGVKFYLSKDSIWFY